MQHVGPWCLVWDLLLWHMESLVVALGLHSAQVQYLKLVGLAASLHVGSYFPDQGSNLDHQSWELGVLATLRTSKEVPCTPFLFWKWSFNLGRHSLTRACLLSFLCDGILASCLALVILSVLVWFSSLPSILRVSPIHPMCFLFHKISRGQFYLHL